MKTLRFTLFMLLALIGLSACHREEIIPEILTFSVNGTYKNFSNTIYVDENLTYGGAEISGLGSGIEELIITFPEIGTGHYTEYDYNLMGAKVTKPNIVYTDSYGNMWKYYGSNYGTSDIQFDIYIDRYDDQGVIMGTFSGRLWSSDDNGAATPLWIDITGGKFSHKILTPARY